jgi:hypothetical protein
MADALVREVLPGTRGSSAFAAVMTGAASEIVLVDVN